MANLRYRKMDLMGLWLDQQGSYAHMSDYGCSGL